MAGSSGHLHEDEGKLAPATVDRHRAIVTLMEELEAVDWYDQRIDATGDAALRDILVHNRDEEKEHASMTLEWIRRHDPVWDAMLHTYLFTDASIVEVEEEAEAGAEPGAVSPGSLGIGALTNKEEL